MTTLAAAAKALVKKVTADIVLDKESRSKVLIFIGSIAAGMLLLLLAPIAVLSTMADIKPPSDNELHFDGAEYLSQLTPEQLERINETEADGSAIAEAMEAKGLRELTIKAQLIYMTFFENKRLPDFTEYVGYFSLDNEKLIPALNKRYGLNISYEDFMRTYTWVMNATINEYLFTDSKTKNAADLAAWCRNAYDSGWGYANNSFGKRTGDDRIRCADNVGLVMGYIRYDAEKKEFTNDTLNLIYTTRGDIDTIPDIEGVGVYDGSQFGVYIGGGNVIFSSAMGGVQFQALSEGSWKSWCTFRDVTYPEIEKTTGA
jgi:hypothetical protein